MRRETRDDQGIRHVEIEIYHVPVGQVFTKLLLSGEYPRRMEFTPDSKHFALVSTESVRLYAVANLRRGKQEQRAYHTLSMVHATAYSSDGRYFAAGGGDGRVRIWDLVHGTGKVRMRRKGSSTGVAFSPDGRYLGAFGTGAFAVFDAKNGRQHFDPKQTSVNRVVAE